MRHPFGDVLNKASIQSGIKTTVRLYLRIIVSFPSNETHLRNCIMTLSRRTSQFCGHEGMVSVTDEFCHSRYTDCGIDKSFMYHFL